MSVLTLEALLARLQQRLPLLEWRMADAPERHRQTRHRFSISSKNAGLHWQWARSAQHLQLARPPTAWRPHVSAREREVLQLLREGLSNAEIARRLVISPSTARFHVASILGRLGATNRTHAVALALERHWLQQDPT